MRKELPTFKYAAETEKWSHLPRHMKKIWGRTCNSDEEVSEIFYGNCLVLENWNFCVCIFFLITSFSFPYFFPQIKNEKKLTELIFHIKYCSFHTLFLEKNYGKITKAYFMSPPLFTILPLVVEVGPCNFRDHQAICMPSEKLPQLLQQSCSFTSQSGSNTFPALWNDSECLWSYFRAV